MRCRKATTTTKTNSRWISLVFTRPRCLVQEYHQAVPGVSISQLSCISLKAHVLSTEQLSHLILVIGRCLTTLREKKSILERFSLSSLLTEEYTVGWGFHSMMANSESFHQDPFPWWAPLVVHWNTSPSPSSYLMCSVKASRKPERQHQPSDTSRCAGDITFFTRLRRSKHAGQVHSSTCDIWLELSFPNTDGPASTIIFSKPTSAPLLLYKGFNSSLRPPIFSITFFPSLCWDQALP